MSRRSVLAALTGVHACELCREEITDDVVRVDEGRMYHLHCFRKHVHEEEIGLYACPGCRTLGSTWDWMAKKSRACRLCGGSGYLSAAAEPCGN